MSEANINSASSKNLSVKGKVTDFSTSSKKIRAARIPKKDQIEDNLPDECGDFDILAENRNMQEHSEDEGFTMEDGEDTPAKEHCREDSVIDIGKLKTELVSKSKKY